MDDRWEEDLISDWEIKQYMEGWDLLLLTLCDTAFWMEATHPVFLPEKTDFVKPV